MGKTRPIKQVNLVRTDSTLPGLPAFAKSKIDANKSLDQHYQYISELVRLQVPRNVVPSQELTEEINDLIQATLMTFWLRLISKEVQIAFSKAYIGCIVRSQCVDMIRRRKRKPTLPLPVDQDGELYQGRALIIPSDGMQDPALEFERKEFIEEIIDDVVRLPAQQRYAMICVLKDEVGGSFPLVDTFRKYGIDIEHVNWPQEVVELQRLRSSLSVARKTLRSTKN